MICAHNPIQINNISLEFTHKTCFKNFTTQVTYGERIAIVGKNGSGKSTLLKILQGLIEPTDGIIKLPKEVQIGYVPQIIEETQEIATLSGGQRVNKALTKALSISPNILLLDEPTNHLDLNNRKSLLKMLRTYTGTLIIVSHDIELLSNYIDKLWHIDNNNIYMFSGNYNDYMREIHIKRNYIEQELFKLKHQKKEIHQNLMHEQHRAKNSRSHGEKSIKQRKWPTIVSNAKATRANETTGRKKSNIKNKKQELSEQLSELYLPKIINPSFSLDTNNLKTNTLVAISNGSIGYIQNIILNNISLSIISGTHIAIKGNNGSGKSTLIKAILNDPNIIKSGNWQVPNNQDIGYLDQHYATLTPNKTVLETIYELVPTWSYTTIRKHLNDFLFSKTEEVDRLVAIISGGEKARLALACIAAKTPKLLMLDEIANNLDLETRNHVIQVLKKYPGTMIVISHDEEFLKAVGITKFYEVAQNRIGTGLLLLP